MHKNMDEIKSKNWSKMQAYLEWNKNKYHNSLEAMKEYNEIDFQNMFLNDPSLFVFFMNIHEKTNPGYDVKKFWNLQVQAYEHLKKDCVLALNLTNDKIKIIEDFDSKVLGPCLISKVDLEKSMTEQKKGKKISYYYDYIEILNLIKKHYLIKVRGVFDSLEYNKQKEIYSRYFPIETYENIQRISPVDSLEANYMSIIRNTIAEQSQYIDFWHYMLENDFSSVSNGSFSNMYNPDEHIPVDLTKIIHNKNILLSYFSEQVKRVFFKEITQISAIDDNINFLIEW